MRKINSFIKKNYKVVIGIIIGGIVFGGFVYASDTFKSSDVEYDNKTSGLTSTTLQGAIDELNEKANKHCPEGYICSVGGMQVSTKNVNIEKAYSYNSTSCITGEESTCKETNCINYQNIGACPAGTIIKYKVNTSTTKYFYVLHDDGKTLTMQQRENTVYNTSWYNIQNDTSNGPLKALEKLESATNGWNNVESQTYTMGSTNFNKTNAYTGCDENLNCVTNTYTLSQRTAKARMITLQEAKSLDCTGSRNSCPIWMYNYLANSTSYGGTVNDTTSMYNNDYWTMSRIANNSAISSYIFTIDYMGKVDRILIDTPYPGVRAVVVINK